LSLIDPLDDFDDDGDGEALIRALVMSKHFSIEILISYCAIKIKNGSKRKTRNYENYARVFGFLLKFMPGDS